MPCGSLKGAPSERVGSKIQGAIGISSVICQGTPRKAMAYRVRAMYAATNTGFLATRCEADGQEARKIYITENRTD